MLTGDASIDAVSRAGLAGLSRFLIEKTALEPGDPAGVDIAKDELAFYPLIYWPIDASAAMPTEEAIARLDAYMQSGGTVLFDTRDQYSSGIDAGSASPATERLRSAPRKSDLEVERVSLVWLPWQVADDGSAEPLYRL